MKLNKRYWLFAGPNDYPKGGMSDFRVSFDTVEDTLVRLASIQEDWFEILDTVTSTIPLRSLNARH
jgi:hypothetical protein